MVRKTVTPQTQAAVLLKSRRRCCICFGLHRDTSIKQGQIAHLDKDSGNSDGNNLAFLCFDHHDQYDGVTSQSKGLTKIEVETFKAELEAAVELVFSRDSSINQSESAVSSKGVAGHYIRDEEYESADITVKRLSDGRYHIDGLALWGMTREYGGNTGELDFVGELIDGKIVYKWSDGYREGVYKVTLKFDAARLVVSEENWHLMHGLNVTFEGEYHKAE